MEVGSYLIYMPWCNFLEALYHPLSYPYDSILGLHWLMVWGTNSRLLKAGPSEGASLRLYGQVKLKGKNILNQIFNFELKKQNKNFSFFHWTHVTASVS